MRVSEILAAGGVVVRPPWQTFEEAVEGLVGALASSGQIPETLCKRAVRAVCEREEMSSTTIVEINVRTYVIRDGRPGVWFFSLDVNRLLPAFTARLTYRLPYCWGRASHVVTDEQWTTKVRRRWPTS